MIKRIKNYFWMLNYMVNEMSKDIAEVRGLLYEQKEDIVEMKLRLFQMELDCDIARMCLDSEPDEEDIE